MNASEQQQFNQLYAKVIQAMKLYGLRQKTIDSYYLSLRRAASYFSRCPDDIAL